MIKTIKEIVAIILALPENLVTNINLLLEELVILKNNIQKISDIIDSNKTLEEQVKEDIKAKLYLSLNKMTISGADKEIIKAMFESITR